MTGKIPQVQCIDRITIVPVSTQRRTPAVLERFLRLIFWIEWQKGTVVLQRQVPTVTNSWQKSCVKDGKVLRFRKSLRGGAQKTVFQKSKAIVVKTPGGQTRSDAKAARQFRAVRAQRARQDSVWSEAQRGQSPRRPDRPSEVRAQGRQDRPSEVRAQRAQ